MTVTLAGYEAARVEIEAERARQIDVEGYSPADDVPKAAQLDMAGLAYLNEPARSVKEGRPLEDPPRIWPWGRRWWKPSTDPARNLVKAGALFMAAIEAAPHTVLIVGAQLREATWRLAVERSTPPREALIELLRDRTGWDWDGEQDEPAPTFGCDTRVPSAEQELAAFADAILDLIGGSATEQVWCVQYQCPPNEAWHKWHDSERHTAASASDLCETLREQEFDSSVQYRVATRRYTAWDAA